MHITSQKGKQNVQRKLNILAFFVPNHCMSKDSEHGGGGGLTLDTFSRRQNQPYWGNIGKIGTSISKIERLITVLVLLVVSENFHCFSKYVVVYYIESRKLFSLYYSSFCKTKLFFIIFLKTYALWKKLEPTLYFHHFPSLFHCTNFSISYYIYIFYINIFRLLKYYINLPKKEV